MSQYFRKPYQLSDGNVNVKLDLSDYLPNAKLKGTTGYDTSNLAAKPYLVCLKAEVDEIDTDRLKTAPAELDKLGNAADNHVAKKIVYEKLG